VDVAVRCEVLLFEVDVRADDAVLEAVELDPEQPGQVLATGFLREDAENVLALAA